MVPISGHVPFVSLKLLSSNSCATQLDDPILFFCSNSQKATTLDVGCASHTHIPSFIHLWQDGGGCNESKSRPPHTLFHSSGLGAPRAEISNHLDCWRTLPPLCHVNPSLPKTSLKSQELSIISTLLAGSPTLQSALLSVSSQLGHLTALTTCLSSIWCGSLRVVFGCLYAVCPWIC